MTNSREKRQARGTAPRSYKSWARIVASSLSDAFCAALDGDSGNDFYHHLNEINMEKNPQSYAMTYDAKERKT